MSDVLGLSREQRAKAESLLATLANAEAELREARSARDAYAVELVRDGASTNAVALVLGISTSKLYTLRRESR